MVFILTNTLFAKIFQEMEDVLKVKISIKERKLSQDGVGGLFLAKLPLKCGLK